MRLYDLVKKLLEEKPERRNSDKKLMWAVWYSLGFADVGKVYYDQFMNKKFPTPETITRCRRKLQERFPSLRASAQIETARREKEQQKGNFVYREQVDAPAAKPPPQWEALKKKLHPDTI